MNMIIEAHRQTPSLHYQVSPATTIRAAELPIARSSLSSLTESTKAESSCFDRILHGCSQLWNWLKGLVFGQTSSLQAENLMEGSLEQNAEVLAKQFIALKKSTQKNSGYCVELDSRDLQRVQLRIEPKGEQNKEIRPPSSSFVKDCTCCRNVFEHTFKKEAPNSFCRKLSAKIRKHDAFAVRSLSGNLLLVPNTFNVKVKMDGWRNLFQLDEEKLKKVFSAVLETINFIKAQNPSYQPKIKWHVGKDGNQTVWLLHTRFET